MKLRRFLSCMMALLLVCGLPLSAFAEKYDLSVGSITVTATDDGNGGTTQTVSQVNGVQNHTETTCTVITQSNSSTPTSNTITITATDNASANVTLEKVNINVGGTGGDNYENGEAAVQVTGNGNVTLELDGENTVQSGKYRAGVEKNTTDSSGKGNLTITDENGTAGSLNAAGGNQGAGIGGAKTKDASNITIAGSAEVTATGGAGSSGIGGGNLGSGSDITISGSAKVTANGGQSGSGIGGGFNGSGSDIIITENAKVTAIGGKNGAGIGGGFNSSIGGFNGSGSDITIRGSAEVTAKGGQSGSGIGGGVDGSGSNITVSENAQVKAQGGKDYSNSLGTIYGAGAAIGGGGKYNDSNPNGTEATPNTNALNEGWIATYTPTTTDLDTVPDSLTYRDNGGTVQTATTDITREAPQSATSTAHGHEAGFKVGDKLVAVTTHNYSSYESDNNATCTHDGTESAKCTVPDCEAKLVRTKPGTMLSHEFGDYIPDANNLATCTKAGTKTATCKNCPATDTVPDPIKDHSMGEYYTDTPATCQEDGVERRDCANCDYSETRTLDKLEHSFTNYISNNDATYETDGTKTAKCDHCDATDTIPDPGSRLVRGETVQPAAPYRVVGQDGKNLACKKAHSSGVLTITVDADFATLTGSASGLKTLKAQGVETVVFITTGATSTFALADLLAQVPSGSTYALTHVGSLVTLTLSSGMDISSILK